MEYCVLMSVYIKEKPEYLKTSVDSMINQTVKPSQIVLVEDGPLTSELYQVIYDLQKENPELFTIVKNPTNLGLGKALAVGLKECKYELVARMDTDDVSVPDRCEQQLKCFEEIPELDIIGGDIEEFIDSTDNVVGIRKTPVEDKEVKKYMRIRCAFNHMAVMFKKQAVIKSGDYQDFFYNEDYFLWVRMQLAGCTFRNTGTVLCKVRVDMNTYSRRGGWKYFKWERILQKYMFKNKIINYPLYLKNVFKRFIVEVLMPNRLRSWVFKHFAREKG